MSFNNLPNGRFQVTAPQGTGQQRFHRIRTVRLREQLSLRAASRRVRLSMQVLKDTEDERNDIRLSSLYLWQKTLAVPTSELLLEPSAPLSEPIRQRACLVRVAKTANTLLEKSRSRSMRSLAETLIQQLAELLPEVQEIGTWPEIGKRRSLAELGRAADRLMHDPFGAMMDSHDTVDPPGQYQ